MNKVVFVDESGDEGLGQGTSDYYVVLALIIEEEKYPDLLRYFKGVRGRHFKNIEMKSSTVGGNTIKRKQVIADLTSENFKLSILVVDKSKLTSSGFHIPSSFIKYLHFQLYQKVISDIYSVYIHSDKIKTQSFMDELKAYIDKKKTLFAKWDFGFLDSKSNECIQAADFLCGTIRRCIEKKETAENRGVFLSHINSRSYIEFFPFSDNSHLYKMHGVERSTYDMLIERKAVEIAYRFINENADSSKIEIQEQVHSLQVLLSDYHLSNGNNWVQIKELKDKHKETFSGSSGDQKIRGVIGKLRDNKVLIVSKRTGGYKIPTRENELYEYLSTQNRTVVPIIGRIKKASDLIKQVTDGNVEILENPKFKDLKHYVEAVTQIDFS